MQLTLEADYAVRIVYTLASEQCRLDACALAEKTGADLLIVVAMGNEMVKVLFACIEEQPFFSAVIWIF